VPGREGGGGKRGTGSWLIRVSESGSGGGLRVASHRSGGNFALGRNPAQTLMSEGEKKKPRVIGRGLNW